MLPRVQSFTSLGPIRHRRHVGYLYEVTSGPCKGERFEQFSAERKRSLLIAGERCAIKALKALYA